MTKLRHNAEYGRFLGTVMADLIYYPVSPLGAFVKSRT